MRRLLRVWAWWTPERIGAVHDVLIITTLLAIMLLGWQIRTIQADTRRNSDANREQLEILREFNGPKAKAEQAARAAKASTSSDCSTQRAIQRALDELADQGAIPRVDVIVPTC